MSSLVPYSDSESDDDDIGKTFEPTCVPEKSLEPTCVPEKPLEPTWVPEKPLEPTCNPEKPLEPTWVPQPYSELPNSIDQEEVLKMMRSALDQFQTRRDDQKSSSSSSEFSFSDDESDGENRKKLQERVPRVRAQKDDPDRQLLLQDLPAIEHLNISRTKSFRSSQISCWLPRQLNYGYLSTYAVVVESVPSSAAIDMDSVIFNAKGEYVGQVMSCIHFYTTRLFFLIKCICRFLMYLVRLVMPSTLYDTIMLLKLQIKIYLLKVSIILFDYQNGFRSVFERKVQMPHGNLMMKFLRVSKTFRMTNKNVSRKRKINLVIERARRIRKCINQILSREKVMAFFRSFE
ncbi:hypothetical protein CHUAL_007637 [Chamberlinius hualienensis]